MNTLGIFVKHPVPGAVKTRLAAALGPKLSAEFYSAFVADLTARFRAVAGRRVLCYSPASAEAAEYFRRLAECKYEIWPQPCGSLGDRLSAFFEEFLTTPDDRTVAIGSDSPTLPAETVGWAFEWLAERDCVIGPATDGGYYLVGLRGRNRPIFEGIDWSTSRVLKQTIDRISAASATLALLPPWYDVDTVDDLSLLQGHVRALQWAGAAVSLENTLCVLHRDALQDDASL
jgi:rSAM/selenodomain-associated transferase 1